MNKIRKKNQCFVRKHGIHSLPNDVLFLLTLGGWGAAVLNNLCRIALFVGTTCSCMLFAQPKPASSGGVEFPVTMRQKVAAGKTPTGTRVEARLTMATLIGGAVLPEGSIFTGEVVESTAKSSLSPSRLSIRMDSVRWKNAFASVKAYLTAWYYPIEISLDEDRSDQQPLRLADGRIQHPGCCITSAKDPAPFPAESPTLELLRSAHGNTLDHREPMEAVQSVSDPQASITLTSTRRTIKLDKTLTYVLAATEFAINK
jgi:hypothetical protein